VHSTDVANRDPSGDHFADPRGALAGARIVSPLPSGFTVRMPFPLPNEIFPFSPGNVALAGAAPSDAINTAAAGNARRNSTPEPLMGAAYRAPERPPTTC
jgi:hypothetical protein